MIIINMQKCLAKDDHVRLRCHTGDAAESDATERRQSGCLPLPGERQQTAGPIEHDVRHRQEKGTDQVRRVAKGILSNLSFDTFCSREQ